MLGNSTRTSAARKAASKPKKPRRDEPFFPSRQLLDASDLRQPFAIRLGIDDRAEHPTAAKEMKRSPAWNWAPVCLLPVAPAVVIESTFKLLP